MATNTVQSSEYEQFLAEIERIEQAMNEAESEFMFITYKKLLSVLNKRHEAATRLNVVLRNKSHRELARQKRAQFHSDATPTT